MYFRKDTTGRRNSAVRLWLRTADDFCRTVSTVDVYEENIKEDAFLRGKSEWATNRETVSSEMILLALAMENPAFKRFRILFDDVDLKRETHICHLSLRWKNIPTAATVCTVGIPLFECLRAPMREAPDSLEGQLAYIRQHWAAFCRRSC